jgi:dipeptidyl-peptidase 4
MRTRTARCAAIAVSLTSIFAAAWAQAQDATDSKSENDALTLEKIFPKTSLFGPSASGMTFSYDGRFASFLYRPYVERRHGSDLYIYDTQTGESRRVTSVGRMSQFQEDTREVRDDREKKAKKAGVRVKGGESDESSIIGDWEGTVRSSSTSAVTKDQAAALSINKGKGDSFSGTLAAGIITLELHDITLDDEGHFEGAVGDEESSVEGAIEGDLDDGALTGSVSLEAPKMRFSFRVDPKTDEANDGPVGVIGATGERLTLGDIVLADDATINDDDEDEAKKMKEEDKAPRYGGVRSVEWSPTASELIFVSSGDLYLLKIDEEKWNEENEGDLYRGELSRLTVTKESERAVQFLPDGTGYTYLRSGSLIKVTWGNHIIEQIDPSLEDGESMAGYRISPDQNRLVFIASKGSGPFSGGVKVNIVNYRSRFAQIRAVTRKMSDDPMSVSESSIYLYDLTGHDEENGTLKKVFTRKSTGPRDTMAVPTWAPDSSKVAFAAFEQASSLVHILEAGFKDEDKAKDENEENEGDADASDDAGDEDADGGDDNEEAQEADDESEEPEFVIEDARVVYKFLHNGGPNTPRMIMPQYLPDSRRLVFLTELSGYRQLHVLDPVYEQLTQLTEGQFEVYPFEISEDHDRLFVTSTRGDPTQRHVFIVNLESGEMTQVSQEEGVYSRVAISDDGSMVLATHTDFGQPRELVRINADGNMKHLTDSHPQETLKLTAVSPEYFTYQNRHDQTIYGHLFKPTDWSADDKRPLLIYVYGGPLGEQKMATRGSFSAPSYFFARYMAEVHGYVTATIDPRGSSGYGGLFEKANYEQVGVPQTEDLVDGARWLAENFGIDEDRMALHGWSFGGFQTQMVMYTEPDVFAVGIAGAGPTEWENYNSWYSTGTIGPSRAGHTDLEKYSLLPKAKNLKGILMLVHGMEDANVLYQDTVRVYRELLKAGKETHVELFLDPTGGHGLGGDVKTINKFRKFEDFLVRRIGEGTPAESSEDAKESEEEDDGSED